jgi:tetratricopeptide (TPR) repeat protein
MELRPAVHARVIREIPGLPGHYAFAHALLHDALADDLTDSQRAALHVRAARALGARSGSDLLRQARVVRHWLESGSVAGALRAAILAQRAGRAATLRGAHFEAVRCFEVALGALTRFAPARGRRTGRELRRARLLLELGASNWRAGAHGRAREHFREVAAIARACGDAELLARAAISSVGSDIGVAPAPELAALCEEAYARRSELIASSATQLLAAYGTSLCMSAARVRGAALVSEAAELAPSDIDPATERALVTGLYYSLPPGAELDVRAELIARADALAQRTGATDLTLLVRFWQISHALEAGDVGRAGCELRTLEVAACGYGDPLYSWLAEMARAALRMLAGDWLEAERLVQSALAAGQRAQAPNAALCWMAQLVWLRRLQGRGDELLEPLRRATEQFPHVTELRATLASLCAELGHETEARLHFERAWREAVQVFAQQGSLFTLCQLAEVAHALRDVEAARELYALLQPFAARCVVVGRGQACAGAVAYYLGLAAIAQGELAVARAHLQVAQRLNAALGAGPQLARTQYELGKLLLMQGGAESAGRGLALSARDLCAHLELPATAAKLSALLEATATVPCDRTASSKPSASEFRKAGDSWSLSYEGTGCSVRDELGLHYIALLLARPHMPVHVLELVDTVQGVAASDAPRGHSDGLGVRAGLTSWQAGIDAQSATQYRRRSEQLERALELADEQADARRAQGLRRELAFLQHELFSRARGRDPSCERARKAVYNCIRHALARVAKEHPALGRHLIVSIKTGAHCVYRPEPARAWATG